MIQIRAVTFLVAAGFACGSTPKPTAQPTAAADPSELEVHAETTEVASHSEPAVVYPKPEKGWHERGEQACPDGATLRGAAPPNGLSLACKRGDRNHGGYVAFYGDGAIQHQGLYKDGQRYGEWIGYYQDGTIMSRSTWSDRGRVVGEELYYYPSGKLSQRATYDDDGDAIGTWTGWYESGVKASETPYENGKMHGTVISWREDGAPMYASVYENGVAEGPQTSYFDTGKKSHERMYSGDQLHGESRQWSSSGKLLGSFEMTRGTGTWTEWWDSGHKRYSIAQTKGTWSGMYTEWHEHGQIATTGRYKDGATIGDWLYYDASGALATKRIYQTDRTTEIGYRDGEKATFGEYNNKTNERVEGQLAGGKRHGTWKTFDRWNDLRRTETYDRGKLKNTVKHERPALPKVESLMTGLEVCDAYIRRAMSCSTLSHYEKRSLGEMATWWKQQLAARKDEGKAEVSETCRNWAEFSDGCRRR